MLAIYTLSDLFSKRPNCFSRYFEQVSFKSLSLRSYNSYKSKICLNYFQQWFITLFYKINFMVMQPSKIVWLCRCSVSTQKTNLCRFFLQCWRLQDSNFNSTGLRHRDLFKKQKNLAKVNFLKLLTKENLLKCFHQFTAYQKRRQIFAHRNFVEKSMCKQSGFLDHQNYVKKSKQKHRGYLDQRNYIEKSSWKQRGSFGQQNYTKKTWKQRGFFDQRNYHQKSTRKLRGNLLKLVFDVST